MPILLYGAEKLDVNQSASCQTQILPGRTWKENPKTVEIYCKWGFPFRFTLAHYEGKNLMQEIELPEESWNWRELPICQHPMFPLNVSLVQQCLKLETYLSTNFTMPICKAILKSPEAESIPDPTRELLKKDFTYILTRVHIHPSLKYAINVAIQGSWLKLWGTALDYGAGGTRHAQAILRALTTPLFGDRLCPAPWSTYPVIENTSTLLDQIKRGHSLQAKIGLWHHPYSARSFCARPSNMQAAGRAQ